MRITGPKSDKHGYCYLFPLLFILTCAIPCSARRYHAYHGNGSSVPLAISSVGPASGSDQGGTAVTVSGSGFEHSASLSFGGITAPTVTYVSSTELKAVTPAHASGTVSVTVTQGHHNETATLTGGFTYTTSTTLSLSGDTPAQGPATGGTVVTITGTGFQSGAGVKFGSLQSSAVSVTSSTQISAMTPAESSGTVGITVSDPNGQSASLPSSFTFTSGPSVTSVSPNSGPVTGGTTVTILGSGFQSGAGVQFGGLAATSETLVSSTELKAVSPASTGGTVSVTVTNTGSQTSTLASAYTYFHIVDLAWTDSSSSISGYNVYRSSTSGGPYTRVNSSLVSGTSFTDSNVQAGQTYFYVTTAVSSNNVESGYSTQAQAIVPSP